MKIKRISLLAAGACALCLSSAALAQNTVTDGIKAWQRSDYKAAVSIWRPLAEKGNADAQFNLGQAYRLGRGVPIDLAAAQSWLEKAARKDHLYAETTLGLLLFDSGDRAKAIQWLKTAAERGEPRAMLVYGTALFNGDGVPHDPAMGYAFVTRAAAQGLEAAKETLGQLDSMVTPEVRRKGTAIALGKSKPKAAPKPAKTAQVAAAKPSGALQPPAKAQPATGPSGKWRIQLGAFSKRSSAETLYDGLSGSAPVAGHPPLYVALGAVTRLQIGGFASKADAAAACSKLSVRGQACFPVSP